MQINQVTRVRTEVLRREKIRQLQEQKKSEAQQVIEQRKEMYERIEKEKEMQMRRSLAIKEFIRKQEEQGKESRKSLMVCHVTTHISISTQSVS